MVGGGGGDGDGEGAGELGELLDDGLFVAWVSVDGDDGSEGEVSSSGGFQLVLEEGGGEVAAGPCAGVTVVGKGDFNEEDLGRWRCGEEGLETAAGVAGEGSGRRTFSDNEADGRRTVGDGQGKDLQSKEVEWLPGRYGMQPIFWTFRRGPDGEVGV